MSTTRNYTFYKFICLNDDINSCYVGSTGNFKKRKADHKLACNNENHGSYNYKIYQTIRENGGWSNWKMIEIGETENITKRDAEQIEEEYRKELKADMNMCRSFTTPEERKEQVKGYNKEYRENNKEHSKEYQKEYRENNKDTNKEYQAKWYENNRGRLNEKHDCECGSKFTTRGKSRHLKTKKHCEYINMSPE